MPAYSTPHMSVYYTADNTGQAGLHAVFQTTTYGGTTSIISQNNIDYDSTNGRFTVGEAGTYVINVSAQLLCSIAMVPDVIRLRKNGATTFWEADAYLAAGNTGTRPRGLVVSVIHTFSTNEYFVFQLNSLSTNTIETGKGTSLSAYKID